MAIAEIRGASFLSFFDALADVRGADAVEQVKDALPRPLRERLRSGAIVGIGWYPMTDYAQLYDALDQVYGGGDALAKQLGAASAHRDTQGILRYVLALSTPEFLLRHAGRVVLSYIRGPTSRLDEVGPGHATLVIEGFGGTNSRIHAEWAGGIQFLLGRCGAKKPSVTWQSSADFETVTYYGTWQP